MVETLPLPIWLKALTESVIFINIQSGFLRQFRKFRPRKNGYGGFCTGKIYFEFWANL